MQFKILTICFELNRSVFLHLSEVLLGEREIVISSLPTDFASTATTSVSESEITIKIT